MAGKWSVHAWEGGAQLVVKWCLYRAAAVPVTREVEWVDVAAAGTTHGLAV